jgi:hypothetical protein
MVKPIAYLLKEVTGVMDILVDMWGKVTSPLLKYTKFVMCKSGP